jgi:hypothetical protein
MNWKQFAFFAVSVLGTGWLWSFIVFPMLATPLASMSWPIGLAVGIIPVAAAYYVYEKKLRSTRI